MKSGLNELILVLRGVNLKQVYIDLVWHLPRQNIHRFSTYEWTWNQPDCHV